MKQTKWLIGAALAVSPLAAVAQGQAQSQAVPVEARVGRLESEMRAVQRRVFPNGAGQNIPPEISTTPPDATVPGTPSGGALIDTTARVAALETQLRELTGQVEQNSHHIQLLEDQFAEFRRATAAAATAPAAVGTVAPSTSDATPPAPRPTLTPAPRPPLPATGTQASGAGHTLSNPNSGTARPATPAPAANDPARQRLVAAVQRPTDPDPAEASYLYGYRLWAAHLYPEAEAQLQQTVQRYATHRRASYAQNLLGRAYLDDGKPSLASFALYDSYRRFPEGERAHESLYYLATALIQLDKASDACRVFTELTEVYPTRIDANMRANITRGRTTAHCH